MKRQLIVLSAPSGAGKTTVARHLLKIFPFLRFSVSATTRERRQSETNARDYFFLTREEFKNRIENGDLIEYEEIFGNYYGTLRSIVQDAINRGEFIVFDVDVKGALSLRNEFPDDTLLIFIAPPDMRTLSERLHNRHTDSNEQIALRLARAEMEMGHVKSFDHVIVNSNLSETLSRAEEIVRLHTLGFPEQQELF